MGCWGRSVYLFFAVLCERWVDDSSSSSSSEPDSLSCLERFFSFSRTCRGNQAPSHHFAPAFGDKNVMVPFFGRHSSTDLFEVGELDELHGHLRVLQLHSFAHSGLGVCRGQTDQSLQRTGRHWGGLRGQKGREQGQRANSWSEHIREQQLYIGKMVFLTQNCWIHLFCLSSLTIVCITELALHTNTGVFNYSGCQSGSHCDSLLGHLKETEPWFKLLVTPALFLLCQVKMSAVKTGSVQVSTT